VSIIEVPVIEVPIIEVPIMPQHTRKEVALSSLEPFGEERS
jgi:hypothetical protein